MDRIAAEDRNWLPSDTEVKRQKEVIEKKYDRLLQLAFENSLLPQQRLQRVTQIGLQAMRLRLVIQYLEVKNNSDIIYDFAHVFHDL